MPQIFMCYRREDSQHVAGRIRDRLVALFQSDGVFIDVHSIAPGVDYRAHLREVLSRCQAVLVVIGDRWLNICDEHGQRRLDRPDDDVRVEIEMALRFNLLVIPLLVGRAPMPYETDLPESLGPLVLRQAIQVRPDPDFHRDVDRLLSALPVDHRVAALQSFALRAGSMLRRIQAGHQDLDRFARELNEAPSQGFNARMSNRGPGSIHDWQRKLSAILSISGSIPEALAHTTPFVSFAYYLDPQIGIGLGNIEEVAQQFRELQAEARGGTRWAESLLGALQNPLAPDDVARRGISLVTELRDQIKMIELEVESVAGIG